MKTAQMLLLGLVLMVTSETLIAQDLKQLQHQANATQTVKQKILSLDALANYYSFTDGGSTKARANGLEIIALAEENKKPDLIAMAYVLNGIRLVEAIPTSEGEIEMRGYFTKAILIAQSNKLPFYEASAYIGLSGIHFHTNLMDGDEALKWGKKALSLSSAIANDSLTAMSHVAIANGYRFKNNAIQAFHHFNTALHLAENLQDPYLLAYSNRAFAKFYVTLGDAKKSLTYYQNAIESLNKKKNLTYRDLHWLFFSQWNTTIGYLTLRDFKNSRESVNKVIELAKKYRLPSTYQHAPVTQLINICIIENKYSDAINLINNNKYLDFFYKSHDYEHNFYLIKAQIFKNTNQIDSADFYYQKSLATLSKSVPVWLPARHLEYGQFLMERGRKGDAIFQLEKAKAKSEEYKSLSVLVASYKNLDKVYYQSGNLIKAYQNNKLYQQYNDSLSHEYKDKELALLDVQNEQKKEEKVQQEERTKMEFLNKMQIYGLLTGVVILIIIAGFLFYNNSQKQKTNSLLIQQKNKIEDTLTQLKSTQAQLIQSEKLASLGELTAGIAHEIQNPLNFVNNFSEVNTELIDEMQQEMDKGNLAEAKEISNDIKENEQKINHHGKRAGDIVKGMLQHSSSASGKKEPTDINKLADEYLRLSYHGLRGKDNSFNADFELIIDKNLPNINVIPQDMGRVLLNLINNAFWAVRTVEKPLVVVKTEQTENQIIISIKDNGIGMTEATKAKIFQPFFTTKPTGQGTGLGLSLAYDIVTKGHGGTLDVESTEGVGSIFILKLKV